MTPANIILRVKNTIPDSNYLFLFLLLLTPFIYFESLFDKAALPQFAFVSILACCWFFTWLIRLDHNKVVITWNPLFLFVLFILLFSMCSYLWGKENTLYQAELYFYTCLVILCFMGMQVNPERIHKFISFSIITAALCAVIGILQNFGINPLSYKQIAPPAATFINKNFATNFLELILPVAITLFLVSKNKKEAWVFAFAVSIIASYLVLTKTRGSYLAIVVMLSTLFIFIRLFPGLKKQAVYVSNIYKKQMVLIILIPFLLISLPSKSFQPDYEKNRYAHFFSGTQQNSISVRLSAYQNSLDLLKENPVFGVGLGGFQLHFRPYTQSMLAKNKIFSDFIYLHNEPLQLFIELGIIGGGAALIFFVFLFRFSFIYLNNETRINSDINNYKIFYLGFSLGIITLLFHSLFSFPFHQSVSATFFALWVGFMLNLSAKKIRLTKIRAHKHIHIILITMSALFLILITNFYHKYIESSNYMQKSITAFEMLNCQKASEYAILSNFTYANDYFSQSQGINIIASCPVGTDKQLNFAENVLKYNPSHPWALYLASISYFKLGNYDISNKLLKSLSFLYPYFTGSYLFLGHIAVKHKQYAQAKSYYKHALKLDPNNNTAQNLLRQLEAKGY